MTKKGGISGKKATGRLRNPEAAIGLVPSLDKRRTALSTVISLKKTRRSSSPAIIFYLSDMYFSISSGVNFRTCVFGYSLNSLIMKTGTPWHVFPLFVFR